MPKSALGSTHWTQSLGAPTSKTASIQLCQGTLLSLSPGPSVCSLEIQATLDIPAIYTLHYTLLRMCLCVCFSVCVYVRFSLYVCVRVCNKRFDPSSFSPK